MSEEEKNAKVLAAAKRLVKAYKAYIKYGKELDTELEALARAAVKRWPEMKDL